MKLAITLTDPIVRNPVTRGALYLYLTTIIAASIMFTEETKRFDSLQAYCISQGGEMSGRDTCKDYNGKILTQPEPRE